MLRTFTTLVSGLTFCLSTMAADVEAVDGNIVYVGKDSHRHQITNTGTDSKSQISTEFDNILGYLNRIESDIENGESRFLPSFIHRNLSQSVEMLRSETIG